MKCRHCGCTDTLACAGGCWWVAAEVCSNCTGRKGQFRAEISPCGPYRYTLSRPPLSSFPDRGAALFCMLNPSTADAKIDDPTIRRCRRFADYWGANGIVVVNLYALRSTDPKALWDHEDPVGELNDYWLRQTVQECGSVVCAWGVNARPDRVAAAVEIFRQSGARLYCLGSTKAGAPRHPLYVRGDQPAVPWEGRP